ncbi:MAG: porin family protein [Acidobacteria bacterium]|nr:porin family protein [Acidobacteriota bacterium]
MRTEMRETPTIRRRWIHVVAVLILLGSARQASAQGFVSPFIGYNFGGDSGCPQITNCEDKHVDWGLGFGVLGSVVGFEAEFGKTSDFFGSTSNQSTDVLTFMGNFMLAPKIGPIQPYGEAGIGLIRTSVENVGENVDENQIGWDIGGGVIAFFSRHVGLRGDVRYFHSFQLLDTSKLPNLPINETKLNFGRFSGALVLKF